MKKLWLIVAVSLGLSATSCRHTPDKEEADTSNRPAPTYGSAGGGSGGDGSATAPAGSGQADKVEKPETLKPGELPAECNEYSAAMEKLTSCTSIPPTVRDALKQSYDGAQKLWATMTPESKAMIAKACKGGADSVAAATTGCK
jgi:hypothetical protein